MQMHSVKSSTIVSIGYDADTHQLRVGFRNAKPCHFCHVPEAMFQAFLNARSKNRFFKRHILGEFPC